MPDNINIEDIDGAFGTGLKCLQCIGEYQMAVSDLDNGILHNGEKPVIPEIRAAITLAPSWQSQIIQGQMVMACVAIPSCFEHLTTTKQSPIERATRNGLALGGSGMS